MLVAMVKGGTRKIKDRVGKRLCRELNAIYMDTTLMHIKLLEI
jgi:hypothetical protein